MYNSDVSYLIPNRVDRSLRLRLDEFAAFHSELVSLRSQRDIPEASPDPDEEEAILRKSERIVSRAATMYGDSIDGGSTRGSIRREHGAFIYDWIHDADAIVWESVDSKEGSDQPWIFSSSIAEDVSSRTEYTVADEAAMEKDSADRGSNYAASDTGSDDEFAIEAIQQATTDGKAAFDKQDFAEANAMLREALKMTRELPTNRQNICDPYELRFMLGVCAFHLDEPSAAKEALLSVVDMTPKAKLQDDMRRRQVLDAGHLLAQTYVKLGELEAARSACDSVLQGCRRMLGKSDKGSLQSLALKARITELLGNPARAKIYASMIPAEVRDSHMKEFVNLTTMGKVVSPDSKEPTHELSTRSGRRVPLFALSAKREQPDRRMSDSKITDKHDPNSSRASEDHLRSDLEMKPPPSFWDASIVPVM